ncbi:hypothetical protein [Coraliomargarita akajimensis]|nr:hypothetical protein [Coraliomargarita akajimensis]
MAEFELELCSPLEGWARGVEPIDSPIGQQIIDIWCQMGMDDAEYTPGAAVSFMQRVRYLLQKHSSPSMALRTAMA